MIETDTVVDRASLLLHSFALPFNEHNVIIYMMVIIIGHNAIIQYVHASITLKVAKSKMPFCI